MNFPKYLSVKEVAAILRVVDVKTIYKKIKKNEIPGHFMLGSMHLFDEEELYKGLKTRVSESSKRKAHVGVNPHKL